LKRSLDQRGLLDQAAGADDARECSGVLFIDMHRYGAAEATLTECLEFATRPAIGAAAPTYMTHAGGARSAARTHPEGVVGATKRRQMAEQMELPVRSGGRSPVAACNSKRQSEARP